MKDLTSISQFQGKIKAITKKNIIVWRRTPIVSLCEVVLPLLIIIGIMYIRKAIVIKKTQGEIQSLQPQSLSNIFQSIYPFNQTNQIPVFFSSLKYPTLSPLGQLNKQASQHAFFDHYDLSAFYFFPEACFIKKDIVRSRIGLSPRDEYTENIVLQLSQWSNQIKQLPIPYKVELQPMFFNSTESMENYVKSETYQLNKNPNSYKKYDSSGLCFGISHEQDQEGTHIFRLHFDDDFSSNNQNIPNQLQSSYNIFSKHGSNFKPYHRYTRDGFSFLQNIIANSILKIESQEPQASIDMIIIPMNSDENKQDSFTLVNQEILPLSIIVIFILPLNRALRQAVKEKESGMRDYLILNGFTISYCHFSLFVHYSMVVTPISLICSLMLHFGKIFVNTNFLILYSFFQLYALSLFGYIMFFQSIYQNSRNAANFGTIIYFLSGLCDYSVSGIYIQQWKKCLMAAFLPTVALKRGLYNIIKFEEGQEGIQFNNASQVYQNYSFAYSYLAFAISLTVYSLLGSIIENGFSFGRYSQQQKSSRVASVAQINSLNDNNADNPFSNEAFELLNNKKMKKQYFQNQEINHLDTNNLLIIKNLCKKFKDDSNLNKKSYCKKTYNQDEYLFTAVDNLSIILIQNQIVALLGHNGAGKTTTIQMLCGLQEATFGKVSWLGKSLIDVSSEENFLQRQFSQDILQLKNQMGICLQNDVFFDFLTVQEHLEFFCNFKEIKKQKITENVDKIMKDLNLYDHRDMIANLLSGGNKRKLSIAISLVADSKLVILDEPTSGMDVTARHRLWQVLKDYKKDRIIIISTHNMEEAEMLGDRIAIMNKGNLIALASPQYLKDQYGYQYLFKIKLNLELTRNCEYNVNKDKIHQFFENNLSLNVNIMEYYFKNEYILQIPNIKCYKLSKFVEKLDKNLVQLNIQTYSIQTVSLDEVYRKIDENQSEKIIEKSTTASKSLENKNISSQELISEQNKNQIEMSITNINKTQFEIPKLNLLNSGQQETNFNEIIRNYRQEQNQCKQFFIHSYAILKRKLQFFRRQTFFIFLETLMPVLFITIGMCFTQVQILKDSPPKIIESSLYNQKQKICVNQYLVRQDIDENQSWLQYFMDFETDPYRYNLYPNEIIENLPEYNQSFYQVNYIEIENKLSRDSFIQDSYRSNASDWLQFNQLIRLSKINQAQEYNQLVEFNNILNLNKFNNNTFQLQYDVSPVLSGAFYIYQANNQSKNFKFATFINASDQDSTVIWPQLMYEAILKTSLGVNSSKFKLINQPFPVTFQQLQWEKTGKGVFISFVVGIGLSLVPASIIQRILQEKENDLQHIQLVSGVHMKSYWFSFFIYDLLISYIPCTLVIGILKMYQIDYGNVWQLLLIYPLSIIPYTYVQSHFFSRESTAQTFTIFWHFLFSSITCFVSFALRSLQDTSVIGDKLLWLFRCICPTFSICNGLLLFQNYELFRSIRTANIYQIRKENFLNNETYAIPDMILPNQQMSIQNIGGEFISLGSHALFWWLIFIIIQIFPKGLYPRILNILRKFFLKKNIENNEEFLDSDVEEEKRNVETFQLEKQLINVHNLRKVYQMPFQKQILAVENTSFSVELGECFALLGVNGAGKSTTFKSLTNEIIPSSGQIKINGKDILKYFDEIRYDIGYCPQTHALFNELTVVEHLQYYSKIKVLPANITQQLIKESIEKLQLGAQLDKQAKFLSGGNKRKLQVAIAILGNPHIILLDEPSSGMDPSAREFMWDLLKNNLISKNNCIILSTHQMREAEELATKMGIMIKGGKFKCIGKPQKIRAKFGKGFEIKLQILEIPKRLLLMYQKLFNFEDLNTYILTNNEIQQLKNQLVFLQEIAENEDNFEKSLISYISGTEQDFQNQKKCEIQKFEISAIKFIKFLHLYVIMYQKMRILTKEFEQIEAFEFYSDKFFRFLVPARPDNQINYAGFLYTLIVNKQNSFQNIVGQSEIQEKQNIQEQIKHHYENFNNIFELSIFPISLETIFSNFASQTKNDKNEENENFEQKIIYKLQKTTDNKIIVERQSNRLKNE